ncbi:MAG: DUF952 domain-containing protein [Dehalococcoidia bacterium]|nr:MAG: DUF952 domain-containing protein [Dehalococcoidia bacterium]
MPSIFHIASVEAWAAAQADGAYHGDTLATEGFIHCSRAEQVEAIANALYLGRHDLILLRIDRALVVPQVRDEPSGSDLFPHIYGPLNLDAVAEVMAFAPGADGRFAGPVSGR